jgi:NTE family protein
MKRMTRASTAVIAWCALAIAGCATAPPSPQSGTASAGKPAKIALVLGAGAAKGFAHIGVLKVLEARNVPVSMVVGTSAGSFVGSLYAYGFDAFTLQKIAMTIDRTDVADFIIPDNGFLSGIKLRDYINMQLRNTPIEKLRTPFYAVATDIRTGKETVFASGNTGMAVQASCAVPGVFKPASFSGTSYVDGGVVAPVAVDVAREHGADVVIAVDITSEIDQSVPTSTIATIMKSVEIMYNRISRQPLSRADVVIKPNVGFVGSADFTRRHEAIMEGERAAQAAMPMIEALVTKLRQDGRIP